MTTITSSTCPLPHPFYQRLQQIIPATEFERVIDTFSLQRQMTLRLNPLRQPVEITLATLQQLSWPLQPYPLPRLPHHCFVIDADYRQPLMHHPLTESGALYPQSLSSIMAVIALNPQPDEAILDLAAAPGGKTSLIAALMQNRGELAAVEPVKKRYFRLQANLARLGVSGCRCFPHDGRTIGHKVPNRFDRVLLDAPCSSESRFNTHTPSSWHHWSLNKIAETARKQRRLLLSAIDALKPGGELLYSTCAFAPEENELVVNYALQRRPQMALVAIDELEGLAPTQPGLTEWRGKSLPQPLTLSRRILPDERWHGFYLAKMVKQAT
ncbi:RsmB/NOP family class I SAM-dependent RNA methyltransferase [Ectothiorhodospiraceae bacterium BW-2]|nr:RsmB/NOP family class I SAM-dependent RNA methyltransferase [Ectothiorhodospiraceae bacterium BW-2]